MIKYQRLKEISQALLMIAVAIALLVVPEYGIQVIVVVLSVIYTVRGIGTLIYYFTMARFMVSGRSILYTGMIMLDFGILTGTLTDVPHYIILIYLAVIHAVSGLIEILRSRESGRFGSAWRLKLFHGVLDIAIAIACVIFIKRYEAAVLIYASGMIYSGILHFISAFRRTKFVYIQ
ncbi:MAG: DUF308 domain-containing protein [Lachnospiraceae bacterium]|nr:DUF308 domain-containing protein [Lachnospiraceae bacterium]